MAEISLEELTDRAKIGDPVAQYDLGVRYQRGDGVKQDIKRAVKWWEKSAERDYAPALYNLGVVYEQGVGARKNASKASGCAVKRMNRNYVFLSRTRR